MSNLTFDHRLLKEHTPEPLEGHAVVVFERVGEAGDELHSILLPGAAPVKPGFPLPFRKRPEYFAYAVDTSPERHLDFNESMRLADHVSEFRVVFNLAYAVSDARALARGRNVDPLRKVRDQVRVVIRREVEQLPWQAVWEAFPQHARVIVDESMEELRAFAGTYGIAIRSLRLSVRLPESMETKLSTIHAAPLDRRVRHVEGTARIEEAMYDSAREAVQKGDLNSAKDMINHIPGFEPFASVGAGGWNGGPAAIGAQQTALPSGVFPTARALPPAAAGAGGLGGVLADIVAATDVVRGRGQKGGLRSALLHLVAEMLVDDLGDGAATTAAAERARAAIGRLDPAPSGAELDALKELADPGRLGRRLDG
jgi:hypothetical protein